MNNFPIWPLGLVALLVLGGFGACTPGCPGYDYFQHAGIEASNRQAEGDGHATYLKAEQDRKVRVLEAQAALEAAKLQAGAEIERARGVSEANKIIGSSLKDNEAYLRWLWIHGLSESGAQKPQVIYVPTEGGLPLLEAGKRP